MAHALTSSGPTVKNEIVGLDPYGRVNMVEPGWTATPRALRELQKDEAIRRVVRTMPLRQIARPVDIARYGMIYGGAQKNLSIAGLTLVIVREEGRYDPVFSVAELRHALVREPPVRLDRQFERAALGQRIRVGPQL